MGLLDFLFGGSNSRSTDNPILDRMVGIPGYTDPGYGDYDLASRLAASGAGFQGHGAEAAAIMERARKNAIDRADIKRANDFAVRILTKRPDLQEAYMADPAGFGKYYLETMTAEDVANKKHEWDVQAAKDLAATQEQLQQERFGQENTTATTLYERQVKEKRRQEQQAIDQEAALHKRTLGEDPNYQLRNRITSDMGGFAQNIQAPGQNVYPGAISTSLDYWRHNTGIHDLTQNEAMQLSMASQSSTKELSDALHQIQVSRSAKPGSFSFSADGMNFSYGGTPQKPTETQIKAGGLKRASDPSYQAIVAGYDELGRGSENFQGNSWWDLASQAGTRLGIPGAGSLATSQMTSPVAQAASDSLRDFAANFGYFKSGANITADENNKIFDAFNPHPGDSKLLRSIKFQRIKAANDAMSYASGEEQMATQNALEAERQKLGVRTLTDEQVYSVVNRIRASMGQPAIGQEDDQQTQAPQLDPNQVMGAVQAFTQQHGRPPTAQEYHQIINPAPPPAQAQSGQPDQPPAMETPEQRRQRLNQKYQLGD